MKKFISVILSIVMLVSVSMATIPAFAIVGSQETVTTPTHNKIIPQVNGKDSSDVTWEWISDNPKQIKFTYNGDGTLEDWDLGDLVEGTDYKVIDRDGNSITIELMDQNFNGDIIANAIIEEEEESTTSPGTTSPGTTSGNVTTAANTSSTSPKTGAAAAAGIAVMGAGVAILTALKKKED